MEEDIEVETEDVTIDTDAAAPLPTTEEAGADPGAQCTGDHLPPTTGTEEEAAGDLGVAAGVSLPEGESILPEDTKRSDQELM